MKLALFLLAFFLSSSLVLGTTYAEKLSTEKGTLDVNLVVELSENNPMQSKLKIDFINPVTRNPSVGILQYCISHMPQLLNLWCKL